MTRCSVCGRALRRPGLTVSGVTFGPTCARRRLGLTVKRAPARPAEDQPALDVPLPQEDNDDRPR